MLQVSIKGQKNNKYTGKWKAVKITKLTAAENVFLTPKIVNKYRKKTNLWTQGKNCSKNMKNGSKEIPKQK